MAQQRQLGPATQAKEDVELMQSLAATHAMFGRLERAISFLHLGLWIIPRDPETLRLMAVLYYRLGHYREAETTIRAYEKSGNSLPEELALIRLRLAADSARD